MLYIELVYTVQVYIFAIDVIMSSYGEIVNPLTLTKNTVLNGISFSKKTLLHGVSSKINCSYMKFVWRRVAMCVFMSVTLIFSLLVNS